MHYALIGQGAIGRYAQAELAARGHHLAATLVRPARLGPPGCVAEVAALPDTVTHVLECAGHGALRQFGAAVLRSGRDLVTVSLGALADAAVAAELEEAAHAGGATLHLASGAIGALDALRAARVGGLQRVRYTGRKPPVGWAGSAAEEVCDLSTLTDTPVTHFNGSARQAALAYPKNANVAAAVALAGIGFDATDVALIADPTVTENTHEVSASGAFGTLSVRIAGAPLPGNPRSSALAAMSAVDTLHRLSQPVRG